jgi:hypothetical protein
MSSLDILVQILEANYGNRLTPELVIGIIKRYAEAQEQATIAAKQEAQNANDTPTD